MQKVQLRGGRILLWRLGSLKFGEQSRWARAPKSRGLWAFPWPYFEESFAYHQYRYLMPKELQSDTHNYPLHGKWYSHEEGGGTLTKYLPTNEKGEVVIPEGWHPGGAFWEAQEKWVEEVGKKVLPRRKFWYEGYLYSHFFPNRQVGAVGNYEGNEPFWHRFHSTEFAALIRKSRGIEVLPPRDEQARRYWFPGSTYSVDHLEVFIAPGEGRITGEDK